MTALSSLPPGIRSYLDEFITRARWLAVARSAGVAVATFLGWLVIACLADRFLHLPRTVRLAAVLGGAAVSVAILMPTLLALRKRRDWLTAAAEVERHQPRFRQRLLTVTSRLLGAADYRGSDEILLRLLHEVDDELSAERPARMLPLRTPMKPWGMCALAVVMIAGLWRVPSLRFRDLAQRFFEPLADVPPVTTTELAVSPGNFEIVQSQPLTIKVDTSRLGTGPVMLHLSDDDRNWSRIAMPPVGEQTYGFSLAAVDRDLHYYLTGGDARTPEYSVRVLRKPVISQFRIRYEYPAYTRLPITVETNTDGKIEAPVGSKVQVTITSSEPLQDALLTVGGEKVLMDRTGDPHTRQATILVRSNAPYAIDLISSRDVPGTSPPGTAIHALVDSPPQARLVRGGDSLRLKPRDILPLGYEALDDYGIQSLVVRAQINSRPAIDVPVRIWGDPRRQQDTLNFDLANLPLSLNDVLTLTLQASDTAGHVARSEPLYVLISPNSSDVEAYARLAELRIAAQLAGALESELLDASKAEAEAAVQKDRHSSVSLSLLSRGDRALTSATQTASLLRQSLLRLVVHSSGAGFSLQLANWIDAGEVESAAAQEAFRQGGNGAGLSKTAREELHRAAASAAHTSAQISVVLQGEQAAELLTLRDDLPRAASAPAGSDEASRRRIRASAERIKKEFNADASQAGLDPAAADLERQLRMRRAARDQLLESAGKIDFAPAVQAWARGLKRDPQQRLGLETRLSAAAQAEALRSDADLPRARDLELASRAAASITGSARGTGQLADGKTLASFIRDFATLLTGPATEAATAQARSELMKLAGDVDPQRTATRPALATSSDRQKEIEDVAMQAGAAAAEHQYQQATTLDRAMLRRLQSRPRREPGRGTTTKPASMEADSLVSTDRIEHQRQAIQRELSAAAKMDALTSQQEQLAQRTDVHTGVDLADRQQTVADEITNIQRQWADSAGSNPDVANARDQATAAVLAAQEQLAAMPQALALAQSAGAARREAAAMADLAASEARTARADQRDAARRAAEQARQNADDAAERLATAIRPVAPGAAEALSRQLEPFAPETEPSRVAIAEELLPALQMLEKSLSSADGEAVDFAASDVRLAIEDVQRELSSAQDQLMRRDPLTAARWFAKAAAQSLTRNPPDLGSAKRHQADVSAALSRAWDQSIHRAATERLALVPSLAGVLGPPVPRTDTAAGSAGQSVKFTAAREWGRLRVQDGPAIENPLHDTDPPGYEQALKLYFEALGRAEGQK